MTDNARRILRAWAVMVGISMLIVLVLAVLATEPDPATRDSTTTIVMEG